MTFEQIVAAVQTVTAGGAIITLVWIIRNLVNREGSLAPRWSLEQEHGERLKSDERADKAITIAEALADAHEKAKR